MLGRARQKDTEQCPVLGLESVRRERERRERGESAKGTPLVASAYTVAA